MDADEESAMAAVAAAELGLDFSRGGVVPSLEFAFTSAHFSDRELRLEIVASDDGASESGGGSTADHDQEHPREEKGVRTVPDVAAIFYYLLSFVSFRHLIFLSKFVVKFVTKPLEKGIA